MRRVVIIGGGIAGLTCAYTLLRSGGPFDVTVVEAEAEPGGQARAFTIDGVTVEHGSHAFFGYYRTILRLIDELRADAELGPTMPDLYHVPGWTVVDAYGRRALLRQHGWLPAALAVLPSILGIPWLTLRDKLGAIVGALRLIQVPYADYAELDRLTSAQLARREGYTEAGVTTWNAASLGLTNLFVDEQSGAIFAGKQRVLIGTPAGLTYKLPAGHLSDLFARPMARLIARLGGKILTGTRATRLEPGRVTIEPGGGLDADHVILAVLPTDAAALAPWVSAPWTGLRSVTPVITITLRLSGRVASSVDGRELGLSREHWVFSVITDLSRFWPEFEGDKTVFRVEVGHADRLPFGADIPEAELVRWVKRDLDRLYPDARPLAVEWAKLHRETRHLYVSWTAGAFARKPTARDLGRGVYLAGDWTTKGTIGMEAAANSGIEAANHVFLREHLPEVTFQDVPLD